MKNLIIKIKELNELCKELEKLMNTTEKLIIRTISIIGWILILIQLFS